MYLTLTSCDVFDIDSGHDRLAFGQISIDKVNLSSRTARRYPMYCRLNMEVAQRDKNFLPKDTNYFPRSNFPLPPLKSFYTFGKSTEQAPRVE